MIEIAAGLLALAGSALALVAAIGVLRLPGFLSRTHAASLAGSAGAGLLLLSAALVAPAPGFVFRAIAAAGFLFLTAPLAAHLLARAAYRADAGEAGSGASPPSDPPEATK